jgi:hypothetical protein
LVYFIRKAHCNEYGATIEQVHYPACGKIGIRIRFGISGRLG